MWTDCQYYNTVEILNRVKLRIDLVKPLYFTNDDTDNIDFASHSASEERNHKSLDSEIVLGFGGVFNY